MHPLLSVLRQSTCKYTHPCILQKNTLRKTKQMRWINNKSSVEQFTLTQLLPKDAGWCCWKSSLLKGLQTMVHGLVISYISRHVGDLSLNVCNRCVQQVYSRSGCLNQPHTPTITLEYIRNDVGVKTRAYQLRVRKKHPHPWWDNRQQRER